MAVNEYYVGQLVHVTAVFTLSGTATDPSAVVVSVKDPNGTMTTPTATKDSTGNYHVDVSAIVAGRYFVRFAGTGVVQAAAEQEFDVLLGHF